MSTGSLYMRFTYPIRLRYVGFFFGEDTGGLVFLATTSGPSRLCASYTHSSQGATMLKFRREWLALDLLER